MPDGLKLILAPQSVFSFSAELFRQYVCSLYSVRTEEGAKEYTARRNAKGTFLITIRRKPKSLTEAEVLEIAADASLSVSAEEVRAYCASKKIKINQE